MTKTLAERFWPKVEKTETCWLWTGAKGSSGYGQIAQGGRGAPILYAHRAAYELLVGTIPDGMQIDHVVARGCRSTLCVNPAHLEPVTGRVNVQRGSIATATHCKRGHEFTERNTYRRRSGTRMCRTCLYARTEARRHALARSAG